jgi:hypothetical protein
MSITRLTSALLGAVMLTAVATAPAAAKRPVPTPTAAPEERPLTAEEEAASAARVAMAEAYLLVEAESGAELSTLACVTPSSTSPEAASDDSTQSYCKVPSAALPVYPRDQRHAHYCGPAVGQVIANYAWKMSSSSNKYSQPRIAGWMQTDVRGYTNAPELEYGLERGTAGAPRRPSNWNWVVTPLRDTDGDGTVADQLHSYVKSNVSYSKMPLAIPVKPYAFGSKYRLSSWSQPVNSVGHWIAAYGWYANWTNSDTPRIYFTDSSKHEGGSTGKFWDPTRHIAALIMEHTRRFVW